MQKVRRIIIIAAAAAFAVSAAGCRENEAGWDDTLPSVTPGVSEPSIVYLTEETTESTASITFETSETTKRTAASESTPELATTASPHSADSSEDGESEISTVPGIPKVPISEFTSSTPLNIADAVTSTASQTSGTVPGTTVPADPSGTGSSVSGRNSLSLPVSGTSSGTAAGSASETGVSGIEYPVKEGSISGDPNSVSASERPYSYKFLSEKQLGIYNAIIKAAEDHSTTVAFSPDDAVTSDEYCGVYQLIYNDEYALFYLDTKMQYAVNSSTKKIANSTIFYKYSENETQKMQAAIDAEVNKILAEITPNMSDYDKVKLFYDRIASSAVYDEGGRNCRDIYGVFVDKRAICGGFSKAFSYLCEKAGIESLTVTGDADGQPHMWNKVKINEKWYNIDVTYAVADSALGSYVRYDYFCVTDEMLTSSRVVYEQSYEYPKAASEDCNYYVRNGLVARNRSDVNEILRRQIIEASKNKEMVVQVQCSGKSLFNDALYDLFDTSKKEALKILDDALPYADNKYDCSVINYSQDSNSLVIKLFLKYTD